MTSKSETCFSSCFSPTPRPLPRGFLLLLPPSKVSPSPPRPQPFAACLSGEVPCRSVIIQDTQWRVNKNDPDRTYSRPKGPGIQNKTVRHPGRGDGGATCRPPIDEALVVLCAIALTPSDQPLCRCSCYHRRHIPQPPHGFPFPHPTTGWLRVKHLGWANGCGQSIKSK